MRERKSPSLVGYENVVGWLLSSRRTGPTMGRTSLVRLVAVVLLVISVMGPVRRIEGGQSGESLPDLMLWAWRRPEDLRFVDPVGIGVAALVGTATLDASGVRMARRLNPLRLPDGVSFLPVVRIEIDFREGPEFNQFLADTLADAMYRLVAIHGEVRRLQLDFDAPLSVRPFYRKLLAALRKRVGDETFLSITALASWCSEKGWLEDLPVDEIVPMAFGMGRGAEVVFDRLAQSASIPSPACRGALGLTTGQLVRIPSGFRRVYLFSPDAWTQERLRKVRGRLQR